MSQETGISGSLRHYNCHDECKEVGHLIEVNYHFRLLSKMKLKIMIPTHENWGSVQASNRRNLKTLAFGFCVSGKHFENGAQFSKSMTSR